MPTYFSVSMYSLTSSCTAELLDSVLAPIAPPGITNRSYLSCEHYPTAQLEIVLSLEWTQARTGPACSLWKSSSGTILIPLEPVAKVTADDAPLAGTKAEVHATPARTRVSYTMVL
jgi:hypothetical protein